MDFKSSILKFPVLMLAGLAMGNPAIAQVDNPRLTPEACDRFEMGMTQAAFEELLDELEIEAERQPVATGNSQVQWVDEETGAVLIVTLREELVSGVSCFGVSPQVEATAGYTHQLCSQVEMGMTLAEVRQALGSPGEVVDTGDGRSLGLLWRWEDPNTNEVAILSFSSFDVLVGSTCMVETPESETPETDATNTQN
ncbi:hypothetical protein [Baaleninema simplex]|uniref:hypothetical protein n=1 Tax=Baaleninema simplex TaxID=2862350 RepID=UPI000349D15D|nr:hypothetical protein [Baaleninema simplex]